MKALICHLALSTAPSVGPSSGPPVLLCPIVISEIRQFHDDYMRACVRADDGVCSERFSVEQSLCQGCVPDPSLLFELFFTTVLIIALVFFRLDPDIIEDILLKIRRRRSTGSGAK